jgi:hypothetical protein
MAAEPERTDEVTHRTVTSYDNDDVCDCTDQYATLIIVEELGREITDCCCTQRENAILGVSS